MRISTQLTPTIVITLFGDETFLFKSLRGGPRIRVHEIRIQEELFWITGYRRFSQIHHEVPEGYRSPWVLLDIPPDIRQEVARLMEFLNSSTIRRQARRLRQEMAFNQPAEV